MVSIRHRSLLRPPWHPSTEDLLLWLDGEIKAKSHNRVEEHLKICWSCRMKRQKIECLISDYMEHRKVQRLEATAAEQEKEIKALSAAMKEQASQIQKVSAQLELGKSAPRIVASHQ